MATDTGVSEDDGRAISVLYVDDYAELCELTAEGLEATSGRLDVGTTTDPESVTDRLGKFDCIVSDYEMPGIDGLELLRQVRVLDDDIPFILFTSEGSEDVASDAISLGVTDYLTKTGGSERFTRLAHRIESVVDAKRATEQVERTRARASEALRTERARFRALIEHSPAATGVLDEFGTFQYASPSTEDIIGYPPQELRGETAFEYIHEEDRERVEREFARSLSNPDYRPTVEYRFKHKNGDWRRLETTGNNRFDDPDVEGFVVNTHDITERKRSEERLRRERDLTERILQVSPSPILVLDADGDILRANRHASTAFDMEPGKIEELSLSSSTVAVRTPSGETVPTERALGPAVAASGRERHEVTYHVTLPTGTFRAVVSAAPLPTSDRQAAVVSVDDVARLDADNNT